MTGYLHQAYADSLRPVGASQWLPQCGGWILRRRIPGATQADAMGCYPLFACRHWQHLRADVEAMRGDLVTLTLVADPFGRYRTSELQAAFPDVCRPYKEHYVVDLCTAPRLPHSANHRRNLARAQGLIEVEESAAPVAHASEWIALYEHLIVRHGISGVAAFPPSTLTAQLQVPGLTMIRAVHDGQTAGITLWYLQDDVAYYHLGAHNEVGYASGASFVMFQFAIDHFRTRATWLNLGAGAGATGDALDGLTRFKRGWASGTRTAWLCGRVFDRRAYAMLASVERHGDAGYFPAYRAGEFR